MPYLFVDISKQLIRITTCIANFSKLIKNLGDRQSIKMKDYEAYGARGNEKGDKNCRTCTDFKSWSNQQRNLFNKVSNTTHEKQMGSHAGDGDKPQRPDCPWDKSQLGSATWGLLHTIAAFFPDNPTKEQKEEVKTFFKTLSKVYPCDYCARDFRKDMKENPICADSQKDLSQWLCKFHNRVNKKLGKPEFDCCKTDERWRDGWKDGSCD